MAGVIEGFRSAFLGNALDVFGITVSLVVSAIIFAAGIVYFAKVERRFADII